MPRTPEIIPATVVHEVVDPSEMVRKLIADLMIDPRAIPSLVLHSSVQRVIRRKDFETHPRFQYARELKSAERTLGGLGRAALLIGDGTELLQAPDGRERLIFHPRDQAQLDSMTAALEAIPSILEQPTTGGHLYVQFAAGSLTKDVGRRRDTLSMIDARTRHMATGPHMKAENPRIVMRDVGIRRPAA